MSDAPLEPIGQAEYLSDIVELQRAELTRLLRENKRLNERVDELIKLQQREQVLRQQIQNALDRLSNGVAATGNADTAKLQEQMRRTEHRFNALRSGVAQLVRTIDRPINVSGQDRKPPADQVAALRGLLEPGR